MVGKTFVEDCVLGVGVEVTFPLSKSGVKIWLWKLIMVGVVVGTNFTTKKDWDFAFPLHPISSTTTDLPFEYPLISRLGTALFHSSMPSHNSCFTAMLSLSYLMAA